MIAEAQKAQPEPIDPEQEKFEVIIEARHLSKSYPNLQRQVRRYLAEGKVRSYEEGELVVKLLEKVVLVPDSPGPHPHSRSTVRRRSSWW